MKNSKVLLLVVLAAAAVMAVAGRALLHRGLSARDQPSAVEAHVARTVRRLAVPSSAKNEKNPFPPSPEFLLEAQEHFADHCSLCHANNGSGNTEIGRNLYPKAPDMRLPQTQDLTDGEIYYTIHNGIRLTGMPAWGAEEKDDDSWKLVLFIRHLPQLSPAEEGQMEALNPKTPAEQQEEQQEQEFLNQDRSSKPGPNHRPIKITEEKP